MKIKKIVSIILVILLAFQCAALTCFATDTIVEMEDIYSLIQNDASEYGYIDYSFVDMNGNPVKFEVGKPSGSNGINTLASTGEELPTKYSLRDSDFITDAKEQGLSNSCWAFSSLGSIESNALRQGENTPDYSEAHLVWFAQNSGSDDIGEGIIRKDAYVKGGNWMLATAALSRWSGTVNETDYPFYPFNLNMMGNYSESERYNTSGGVIINSAEALSSVAQIKTWIMNNGAVEANFYYDPQFLNTNLKTFSYCCNDSSFEENHAILIVGWDDYYSKSNFNSSSKPAYPGAFLCKNSWGTDWSDEGYFWLSYFDATIMGLMGYTCVDSDTYDNNYTYNGLGYGGAYKNTSANGSQIANVFTSKGYETLSAISTYTLQSDTYAEVFVYKNLPDNYSKPNQGTLAYSSKKILISNAGYHTVPIDTPVSLEPDEIFSVVIRLSNSSNLLYVVGEYNSSSDNALYSSKRRQSYIDTSGTNSNWYDSLDYGWNNNCIQAFTVCNHQSYDVETPSTCETNGSIISYCSQCGEQLLSQTIAASGHTLGEWKTTKLPTKTSEGEKVRTCEFCDYAETQILHCLPEPTKRVVNMNQLFEIIKIFVDSFFNRIRERY